MQRRTFHTAIVITKDKPTAEAFADEVSMTKDEREQIAQLSEAVCLQYQIMGQHAPAIFLGAHLMGYGTKVFLTLNRLEDLAKYNRSNPAPKSAEQAKAA